MKPKPCANKLQQWSKKRWGKAEVEMTTVLSVNESSLLLKAKRLIAHFGIQKIKNPKSRSL